MSKFIGRKIELDRLNELTKKNTASFVVVNGRRRIGKSRLIEEFSKNFSNYYTFIGLSPHKNTTLKDQLNEFSRQIARQFKTSLAKYDDWGDAFWSIGERVQSGKILLLFDEISWMGSLDTTFLAKIKNFWDQQLSKNPQLIFIICGSASAWIEKNILSSTGFVGRISYTLTLEELSLYDCNNFWLQSNISAYEKLKILSITGGVPKYLEELNPKLSAEENIKRLCFTKGGFLVEEFNQIFSDLFLRKTAFYKKIVAILASGAKEQSEIFRALDNTHYGRLPEYLRELQLAGFVSRDYTWNIKTYKDASLSKYRLHDNYLRFYLKYIEPNLSKINRNMFVLQSLTSLPQWYSILGLQFENLVLNNRKAIHYLLGLKQEEVVCENSFFQHKTIRTAGCQIDYMVQTKFDTLYVCEIKFSKNVINSSIIKEVQTKINLLKRPKCYSCRPVLIHVNGVSEEVIDTNYFASIIDFGNLLSGNNI